MSISLRKLQLIFAYLAELDNCKVPGTLIGSVLRNMNSSTLVIWAWTKPAVAQSADEIVWILI